MHSKGRIFWIKLSGPGTIPDVLLLFFFYSLAHSVQKCGWNAFLFSNKVSQFPMHCLCYIQQRYLVEISTIHKTNFLWFEMFMNNVFAFWRNWPLIFCELLSNLNCSVNSFIYLHQSIYKTLSTIFCSSKVQFKMEMKRNKLARWN